MLLCGKLGFWVVDKVVDIVDKPGITEKFKPESYIVTKISSKACEN